MNNLELTLKSKPRTDRNILLETAKSFAFNYYLRKGIHLNPAQIVENIEKQISTKKTAGEFVRELSVEIIRAVLEAVLSESAPSERWDDFDFLRYFFLGNGVGIQLDQIGHLDNVIAHANQTAIKNFRRQICDEAISAPDGPISFSFSNTYHFGTVQFSHGNSTLRGKFSGNVRWTENGVRWFSGIAHVKFSDIYRDSANFEKLASALHERTQIIDQYLWEFAGGEGNLPPNIAVEFISEVLRRNTELGGIPYAIEGEWDVEIEGNANHCELYERYN